MKNLKKIASIGILMVFFVTAALFAAPEDASKLEFTYTCSVDLLDNSDVVEDSGFATMVIVDQPDIQAAFEDSFTGFFEANGIPTVAAHDVFPDRITADNLTDAFAAIGNDKTRYMIVLNTLGGRFYPSGAISNYSALVFIYDTYRSAGDNMIFSSQFNFSSDDDLKVGRAASLSEMGTTIITTVLYEFFQLI